MRRLALFFALTGLVWAAPLVTKVKLLRDNGGKPGAEVEYFKPGERKIHFLVLFDRLTVGKTKVHLVFTGVDTSAGKNLEVKQLDMQALVANEVSASVALPRDWPYGTYRADLFVNGQKLKSIDYVISPSADEVKSTGSALFRDDGKGGEGARVSKFSPKDRNLHFEMGLNGYLMGKAIVRWSYVALQTTAGNNREITAQDTDLSNFRGNTLTGNCELPRDWPKGTYEARVSINGRAVGKIPFTVE